MFTTDHISTRRRNKSARGCTYPRDNGDSHTWSISKFNHMTTVYKKWNALHSNFESEILSPIKCNNQHLYRDGILWKDSRTSTDESNPSCIKGANILRNHKGACKLGDFGVSYVLDSTLNKAKTILGTPYWMAPGLFLSDFNNFARGCTCDRWSVRL